MREGDRLWLVISPGLAANLIKQLFSIHRYCHHPNQDISATFAWQERWMFCVSFVYMLGKSLPIRHASSWGLNLKSDWFRWSRYVFFIVTMSSRQGQNLIQSAQCWRWLHGCSRRSSSSAPECLRHPCGESGKMVILQLITFMQTLYKRVLTKMRELVTPTSSFAPKNQ